MIPPQQKSPCEVALLRSVYKLYIYIYPYTKIILLYIENSID